jgi:6,7-dimethyl-8-ribityllumazine synthase
VAREHRAKLDGSGRSFAIVVSRTNEVVTNRLRGGAIDCLERHGVEPDSIDVYWVPGAFEVPLVASKLAQSGRFDAVITVGAVIRGGTSHWEQVASAVARGIANASETSGVPIIFGIVIADTLEQAVDRAGAKAGNRGFDAALSALEMANLLAGEDTPGGRSSRRKRGA